MIEYRVFISRPSDTDQELESKKFAKQFGKKFMGALVDGSEEIIDEIYGDIPEHHVLDQVEIKSDKELTAEEIKDLIPIDDIRLFDFYIEGE